MLGYGPSRAALRLLARRRDVFTDPFRLDVGRDPNKHLPVRYALR